MKTITKDDIEKKAQQLAQYKVIMPATWLMDALSEYSENHRDDAVFDVDEYYRGGREYCPECGSYDIVQTWEYKEENPDWDPKDKIQKEYICKDCKTLFDDPSINEIYEYWFVDDGFANLLREKGECVLDSWIPIWGRCSTGQAIYLDGVIQEIAKELLEKYGF